MHAFLSFFLPLHRYEHSVDHCTHGDKCDLGGCQFGRRHSSVHILSGAVLPLMKRLEQLRSRSMWGRCARSRGVPACSTGPGCQLGC